MLSTAKQGRISYKRSVVSYQKNTRVKPDLINPRAKTKAKALQYLVVALLSYFLNMM